MGDKRCCCGQCDCQCICDKCKDAGELPNAPCCWQVYFTLLPEDYAAYAGVYYMTQDNPGGCTWSRNYPPACGPKTSFVISDDAYYSGGYVITITLDPPGLDPLVFELTFDDKPDCCQRGPIVALLTSGQEPPPGGTPSATAYCTDLTSCPLLPCKPCDGATLPRFMQVTIPGPMYNNCGWCIDCEDFPGTYILELVEGCPNDGCKWVADISDVVLCRSWPSGSPLYKHTIELWYDTVSHYWYMEVLMDRSNPMNAGLEFAITGSDCSTITSSGKMGAPIHPSEPACSPHPDYPCQPYYVAFEAIPNV